MRKLYFIAEIGQNHQGSLQIAKQMIDSLIGSGINAIKTAKRDIDICLTEEQKNKIYNNNNSFGKTYYEHRKALEFSFEEFYELKKYSELRGFDFISSFTDSNSFDFLKSIELKKIKIASQRITDIKLLEYVSKNYCDTVYMSSGMSNIKDIDKMIEIFKNNKKYLMQCSSIYPCPEKFINLRVLKTYRSKYKNCVDGFGFSSHNMNIAPDIAAFTLGADIIERHYTLDRNMKGTDHKASLELKDIRQLVKYVKQVESCLGTSEKNILENEQEAIKKLRADL